VAVPDTTTTCADELSFLSEYYGFRDPNPVADDGPEGADERVEPAATEDTADSVEARAEAEATSGGGSSGCGGSGEHTTTGALVALWIVVRLREQAKSLTHDPTL
jgi:hypothetical protein